MVLKFNIIFEPIQIREAMTKMNILIGWLFQNVSPPPDFTNSWEIEISLILDIKQQVLIIVFTWYSLNIWLSWKS
jgi:hypothetical protein